MTVPSTLLTSLTARWAVKRRTTLVFKEKRREQHKAQRRQERFTLRFKAKRREQHKAQRRQEREEAVAPRVGADIAGSCEVREGAVRTSLWQCCGGGSASAVVDSSGASCVDSGGGSGW